MTLYYHRNVNNPSLSLYPPSYTPWYTTSSSSLPYPPLPPSIVIGTIMIIIYVDSATLPAKGICVSTLLLGIYLLKLV